MALLLLDNAPCHPKDGELKSDDGLITVMCFPPNCTALIQPMDQNVINITKLYYKKSLLAHLIGSKGSNIEEKIKAFTLRNAVCLLSNAWDQLPSDMIKKCWKKIMYPKNHWTDEDNLPLSVIRAEVERENSLLLSVSDYFQEIMPEETISNDEINEWIFENVDNGSNYCCENLDEVEEIDNSDENVVEIPKLSRITHQTAIDSYNNCIQWAEENEMDLKDILVLQNHRESAVQKNISAKKTQSKISDFFKK